MRKIWLHIFYFSFWTLLPLVAAIPFERSREEAYVISLAFGTFLSAIAFLLNSSKIFYFLTLPILAIPGLIDIGHIWLFRGRITSNVFFSVFDTNVAETSEFLQDYITFGMILFLLSYLMLMLNLLRWCLKNPVQLPLKKKMILLALGLAPMILISFKKGGVTWAERMGTGISIIKISTAYMDYVTQIESYKKIVEDGVQFEDPVTLLNDMPATHVLIVGESAARNHWSLYGYPRNTNPLLSQRKELKVFKHVLCPTPPHTAINIQKLLTFSTTKNFKMDKVSPSIIQIAKKAGFKTIWLSNQVLLGKSNNMTTVLAKQADKKQFLNISKGISHDEILLPPLKEALNDPAPKKLIIMHLFGNHSLYKERYPSSFAKFSGKEGITSKVELSKTALSRINEYDNSVLYQDHVLNEILTLVQAQADSMVFVPDHGEEVYDEIDFNGHSEVYGTKGMYQIPLLLWAKDTTGLTIDLNRKFISENLINSVSQLYGWSYPSQDLSKSLLSDSYVNDEVLVVNKKQIDY